MSAIRVIAFIIPTVLLVSYSQVVVKWRIPKFGVFPADNWDRVMFLMRALFDPFIASGVLAAFIASLTWLVAISKISLNVAFPLYYGLTFALVVLGSILLLNEPISIPKLVGIVLILSGVIIGSLG